MSLNNTERYIQKNGHLPGIPTAQEVSTKGVSMGDMQARLLEKVEELTLHLIAIEKKNSQLEQENQEMKARLDRLPQTMRK
jgi:hypothetical protein